MRVYVPRPNAGIFYAGEFAVNVTSNTVEVRSPHRRRVFVYTIAGGGRLLSVESVTPVRLGVASIVTMGGQEAGEQ